MSEATQTNPRFLAPKATAARRQTHEIAKLVTIDSDPFVRESGESKSEHLKRLAEQNSGYELEWYEVEKSKINSARHHLARGGACLPVIVLDDGSALTVIYGEAWVSAAALRGCLTVEAIVFRTTNDAEKDEATGIGVEAGTAGATVDAAARRIEEALQGMRALAAFPAPLGTA